MDLSKLITAYRKHKDALFDISDNIKTHARQLLRELQDIDGWQCMIEHCYDHYSSIKEVFFQLCEVEFTGDSVIFVKGYSNGDDYNVLTINLHKSLQQQVLERLELIHLENKSSEEKEKEKDMAEFERIKEKYGL